MSRVKKSYSRSFKLLVLRDASTQKDIEVCRKYGIHPSLLFKWKKEFQRDQDKAFRGKDDTWKLRVENERYKVLIGELYSEIDLLKKTLNRLHEIREEEMRCSK